MRRWGGKGILIQDDQTGTLSTVQNQAVCYEPASAMEENWRESDIKNALRAEQSKSNHAVAYPEVSRTLSARHDSSPCIDRGQEFVCYAKTAKPRNADEAPTIVESDIAPTLGTHDISEARQNQYVVFPDTDVMQTLTARNSGGDNGCRTKEI